MLQFQTRAIRTMIKMMLGTKMKKQLLPQLPQRVLQLVQQQLQLLRRQQQLQLHLPPQRHYQQLNRVHR